jgi:predicted tellurium resistance membrane protein TerC
MEEIFAFHNLLTFLSLSGLEIVLGIDNVIFIAIIIYSIPKPRRNKVRIFGISLAIALRILMLFGVSWVMSLTIPLFSLLNIEFTGRSLLLLTGGVFLIIKALTELYDMLNDDLSEKLGRKGYDIQKEYRIILQIIFVDLVLSFDSVIVAVGMVNKLSLIIPAILVAMVAMLISAKAIGDFMHSNPSIKVLGLAFVLLVGIALAVGGFGIDVPKGYLYAVMFFSLFVEVVNIRVRKIRQHKT